MNKRPRFSRKKKQCVVVGTYFGQFFPTNLFRRPFSTTSVMFAGLEVGYHYTFKL